MLTDGDRLLAERRENYLRTGGSAASRSHILALVLQLEERVVDPTLRHQFAVRPGLHKLPVLQDHDPIGKANGVQPGSNRP